MNYSSNKKLNAFTLAEVLITLGIIGVVAAITIPILIQNAQNKEFSESLRKFHSDLSQAVQLIQSNDSGLIIPENDTDAIESGTMRDNLCEKMSCITLDTVQNIFGDNIFHSSGSTKYKNYKSSAQAYTDITTWHSAATLKNGMMFGITNNIETRKGFQLYVDTNGQKGPNMFGMDFNMFEIMKDNNGIYRALVEGSKGTYSQIIPGRTCLTDQPATVYHNVWTCCYYRLYAPDDLP